MSETKSPGTTGIREGEVRTHVEPKEDSSGNKKSVEDNVKTEKELQDSDQRS